MPPSNPLTSLLTKQPGKAARKKLPPGLPKYKPLPSGWKHSQHYWFYGWAVSNDILRNYVLKYDPLNVPDNATMVNGIALSDLQNRSGYPHVCFVGGKPDRETISQGRVFQTPYGPQVDLLAISCTRSTRLFHRRPTEEQLAMLVELLGEEPRWFEDCAVKADFAMGLVD